jgi:hypothetical protein
LLRLLVLEKQQREPVWKDAITEEYQYILKDDAQDIIQEPEREVCGNFQVDQ